MLKSLHISHYVLIDSLDIDFRPGFSVMTGQTGAGKSIILGALNLLMGQRAESRTISEDADKCVIEGHFDLTGYGLQEAFTEYGLDYDEADTIFRREVLKSGKSRAFINDTPVGLSELKDIGSRLIDIHSQHQNLLLGTETFQTYVTDTIAGNTELLKEYRECYRQHVECSHRLQELREEEAASHSERDYIQFQYDELEKVRLISGEQEQLENEQEILSHAEEIKESLYQAMSFLNGESDGAVMRTRQALQSMKNAAHGISTVQELTGRLESCLIELRDICSEAERIEEDTSYNPERLEYISNRLSTIYSLQKKHNCTSEDSLIELVSTLQEKLSRIGSFGEEIAKLEQREKSLRDKLQTLSASLSESRRKAAGNIRKMIMQMLAPLGIKGGQFHIDITHKDSFDWNGSDHISFMFAANQGSSLQELAQTASGGEISRVMLIIKSLLAGAMDLPTVIFDEIDTGVSGAVAEQMALTMRRMCSEGRQVIAITHLPQIASKGDTHYLVYKNETDGSTHTYISELNREQRITEIARMISGATITDAALDNARALIDN